MHRQNKDEEQVKSPCPYFDFIHGRIQFFWCKEKLLVELCEVTPKLRKWKRKGISRARSLLLRTLKG
jgi:hypothetical protein